MLPTEILKEEHRVIERMLAVLRRAAAKLEAGERVNGAVLEQAIDFIRNFADSYHHAKEEDALFVAMEAHGIPRRGGPIEMMLLEHEEGRAHVRGMSQALEEYSSGKETAGAALAEHARGYAELLEAHIYKEDNILYPMGERVLPQSVQQELLEQFARLEQKVFGAAERQRYVKMVDELDKLV